MTGAWRFVTDPITCIRRWFWFPRVGPAEIVRAVVPACTRAAALALPLMLPGAAFLPARAPDYVRPAYASGPAYAPFEGGGGLFVPGYNETPAIVRLSDRSAPASGMLAEVTSARLTAAGGSPATDVTPVTSVPEPSTLLLLAGVCVVWMLVSGERE